MVKGFLQKFFKNFANSKECITFAATLVFITSYVEVWI
jgi:hypothetical protein